jgi:hypothetical protein
MRAGIFRYVSGQITTFGLVLGADLGAFCTMYRAGPLWRGPRAKFGRTAVENQRTFTNIYENLRKSTRIFSFPCWSTTHVLALWEAFYIEKMRFDLDALRVPNRSPTPISKSNDFFGLSEDIWGTRGLHFRPILGVPGARAGLKNTYCF